MKSHAVASKRRTQRRLQLSAPSSIKRGDEVKILKGKFKGKKGKVVQVYRRRSIIHVDKITREKQNGQSVFWPIRPSYCVIEKLLENKDRKKTIERRAAIKIKASEKHKE